jgi:serine/threonine protein kinase
LATQAAVQRAEPAASALPARVGRYEVLEELAHGGMGAVFKVRDPDLGRTLALKVLLDCHQDRPDLQRRFLEEAQLGGQLQHPGLVPVHELGRLPDQRPFFTMKLVKGRTLAELLNERATPAAELARFVGLPCWKRPLRSSPIMPWPWQNWRGGLRKKAIASAAWP